MGCGGGRACLPLEKHPLRAEQCKIQPVKRCPLFPFLISPFVITTWKARGLCGLAVFPVIWVHKGNTCEIRGCDAFHLPQTTDFSECLLTGMPQHAFKVLWFRSEDKIKLAAVAGAGSLSKYRTKCLSMVSQLMSPSSVPLCFSFVPGNLCLMRYEPCQSGPEMGIVWSAGIERSKHSFTWNQKPTWWLERDLS